jgi:hypothetical protein
MLRAGRVDYFSSNIPNPPPLSAPSFATGDKKVRLVVRANLLAWSFGLVSVSLLAGCAMFEKNTCEKCGGTTHGHVRNRLAVATPKKATTSIARTKTIKPNQSEGELKLTGHANATSEPEVLDDAAIKLAQGSAASPYKVEYLPAASEVVSQKIISETPPPVTADGEKNVVLKNVAFKYGRGANFESVTGQVQIFRKTMRLRYASIEQEDAYGGVVILEGSEISNLRDGQHVRVQGTFVAPSDRHGSAKYRVQSVELLD